MRFALLMAWRDFKARPSRFVLYAFAVAVGVGAISAIDSYRRQVADAVEDQGRNLLGADVLLRSRWPFNEEQSALVASWTGRSARAISYRTMLAEPRSGQTRLVEVEAVGDGYPFYGTYDTDPPAAGEHFPADGRILIDRNLALQLDLGKGAQVTVGGQAFDVGGVILQTPGEVPARSLVAPKVVVPLSAVDAARLSQPGTMARHEYYLAAGHGVMDPSGLDGLVRAARRLGLDAETVETRREQLLGNTDRIGQYLSLTGFSSLLIGCLGVVGAVNLFIRARRRMVAQLRCIGAQMYQAAGLFIVQLVMLSAMGATLGIGIGAAAGQLLPEVLGVFLPVEASFTLRRESVLMAWLTGMVFTVLAGLMPVNRLRFVRPLASLRHESSERRRIMDPAGAALMLLFTGTLLVFAAWQLESFKVAGTYLGGVAVVVLLLFTTGMLVRRICRKVFRGGWPLHLRLAVGGLYRPENQTGLLVVALGLGIFLLNAVEQLETHMIEDLQAEGRPRPNIAMIDIQTDQKPALLELLARYPHETPYVEPMVTMRLDAINGIPVDVLETRPEPVRQNWALKREYRTTYRRELKPEIERLIDGTWVGSVEPGTSPVPVSLEDGIAEALAVTTGDRLTFDIHGVPIETVVASKREADWKSMQPNFFLVFPEGAIDDAPQSLLVFCRMDDARDRAEFQYAVARAFPNVTSIDISLVMDSVSAMLSQLSFAVRTIAWFTLAAGFLIVLAIVRAGRAQRMREAVLLRTLGAPRTMIRMTHVLEIGMLAAASLASGLFLSWVGAGLVIHFAMDLPYRPDVVAPLRSAAILLVALFGIAAVGTARIARERPAQAWRALEWPVDSKVNDTGEAREGPSR